MFDHPKIVIMHVNLFSSPKLLSFSPKCLEEQFWWLCLRKSSVLEKPSWIPYFLKQKQQVMWRTRLWEPAEWASSAEKALLKRRNNCYHLKKTWCSLHSLLAARRRNAPPASSVLEMTLHEALLSKPRMTQTSQGSTVGNWKENSKALFSQSWGKKTEKSEHLSAFFCLKILQEL